MAGKATAHRQEAGIPSGSPEAELHAALIELAEHLARMAAEEDHIRSLEQANDAPDRERNPS